MPFDKLLTTAVLVGGLLVIGAATPARAEAARVFTGPAVKVGSGDARVLVETGPAGKPSSVGVVLTAAALQGLPAARPDQHEWEFVLAMPEGAPPTGYDHVTVNWNPAGHPPKGVYSVPHFDVHFYLVGRDEREQVTFQGAGAADALKPPGADLVPPGYAVPPDSAVEKMGLHGVHTAGPEFHGKPFTQTFIYGYHKGALTFLEPMVATDFLATDPDVTTEVARPKTYTHPGYYPTAYRIRSDAGKSYLIAMTGLTPWRMD